MQTRMRADEGAGHTATGPNPDTGGQSVSELKHVYHRSALFKKAWSIARHNAKHGGGSVRLYFAQALRQSWADAKALAQRSAESNARVQAAIEQIKALHTKEAEAERAARTAFQARFFPGRRSYVRRAA
jgi:hypothetical protein